MICYRELMKTTSAAYMKRCSKCPYEKGQTIKFVNFLLCTYTVAPLIRMFYLLINSKTINLGCYEIHSQTNQAAQTSKQPILPIRAVPITENLCWEDSLMI